MTNQLGAALDYMLDITDDKLNNGPEAGEPYHLEHIAVYRTELNRLLFMKARLDNNQLTKADIAELEAELEDQAQL